MGGTHTAGKLRAVSMAWLIVFAAFVQPIGGGLATAAAVGNTAGNASVEITGGTAVDAGTDHRVEVGYALGTAGNTPSNFAVVLTNGSDRIAGSGPLSAQNGTANLTVPAGAVTNDFTGTAMLVNTTANRTAVADDTAAFTVTNTSATPVPTTPTPTDTATPATPVPTTPVPTTPTPTDTATPTASPPSTSGNVSVTGETYDDSSPTVVDASYTASGVAVSDLSVAVVNATGGNGTLVGENASLTGQTGTALVSVPAGALSGNVTLRVALFDTGNNTELASDTELYVAESNDAPSAGVVPVGNVTAGETVTLDGRDSLDPDGTLTAYNWTVTDPNGNTLNATGETVSFTPPSSGTYTIALTVTDDDGATDTTTRTVTVEPATVTAPVAVLSVPPTATVGETVTLNGSRSEGSITAYDWTVTDPNGNTTSLSGETVPFTPSTDGTYTVTLTVTNDTGATNTTTQTLSVESTAGTPQVVSSSVSHVDGTRPEMANVSVDAFFAGGLLQIQLVNATADPASTAEKYELAGLGADDSTRLRVTVTTDGFVPRSAIGSARNATWERTRVADGRWQTTVTGQPATVFSYFQNGTAPETWNGSVVASEGQQQTITFAVDDLADAPAEFRERTNGTLTTTDAQSFTPLSYENRTGPDRLTTTLSAPHFETDGTTVNEGFFTARLPPSLLAAWGVQPDQLRGLFDGQRQNVTVTQTADGGAVVSFPVTYSSGTAAVTYERNETTGGGGSEPGGETPTLDHPFDASVTDDEGAEPPVTSNRLTVETDRRLVFDGGANYSLQVVRAGTPVATLTVDNLSVAAGGRLELDVTAPDGTADPAPSAFTFNEESGAFRTSSVSVVNGTLPDEQGVVNYSVTLTDASGTVLSKTQPAPRVFGYVGGVNVTEADSTVTLSLPRSVLPNDTTGQISLNPYGEQEETVTARANLTYDPATDSFRATVARSALPNGSYEVRVDFPLSPGHAYSLQDESIGRVRVGSNSSALTPTLRHPRAPAQFGAGDPQRLSTRLTVLSDAPLAFDNGNNYTVAVYREGQRAATLRVDGQLRVRTGERLDFELHELDGSPADSPVVSVFRDGRETVPVTVVSGAIPNETGPGATAANYSVALRDADTGDTLSRTNQTTTVFDYVGELNATVQSDGSVVLSVPRSGLPRATPARATVFETANDSSPVAVERPLSYDETTDTFRVRTAPGALSEGDHAYRVSFQVFESRLTVRSNLTGPVTVGEVPFSLRAPESAGRVGDGDRPPRLSNRVTLRPSTRLTFDNGTRYRIDVVRNGTQIARLAPAGALTATAGDRFALELHRPDGTARANPVLQTFRDRRLTAPLTVVSGSIPDERGVANYSVVLRSARTGDELARTDNRTLLFDYRGEPSATRSGGQVTVSLPRSSLPRSASPTLRLFEAEPFESPAVATVELTYDPATDAFTASVPGERVENGSYGYDVAVALSAGQFGLSSEVSGRLPVGGVTLSGTVLAPDGSGAAGTVTVFTDQFRRAETADGQFSLSAAPGATVSTASFRQPTNRSLAYPRDGVPDFTPLGELTGEIDRSRTVTAQLSDPSVLRIEVVDENGAPIPGDDLTVSVDRHVAGFDSGSVGITSRGVIVRNGEIVFGGGRPGLELTGNVTVAATASRQESRFGDARAVRNVSLDENRTVTLTLPTEDRPPAARLALNRSNVLVGQAVRLNGTASRDNVGIVDGRITVDGPDGVETFRRPVVAFTPTAPGTYQVTLNVTDAAGNRNETTREIQVRQRADVSYDYTLSGFVAGQVPPDGQLTVTATARNDGATAVERTVALRVDGAVVAERTVTVGGDDTTQVQFRRSLSPGSYNVSVNEQRPRTVQVAEPANTSVSLSVSETVVNTSEPLTLTATVDNTGDLPGERTVRFRAGGETLERTVLVGAGETETANVTVRFDEPGTRLVRTDATRPVAVTVRRPTNPTASVTPTAPAEGAAVGTPRPTLTFDQTNTSEGIATALVAVDGGSLQPVAGNLSADSRSVTLPLDGGTLADGRHTVTVALRDRLGNVVSRQTRPFVVDTADPTVSVETPPVVGPETTATVNVTASDQTLNISNVTVGSTTTDLTDRLADGAATVEVGGSARTTGTYDLTVAVTDRVGNVTTATEQVRVDATPPTASVDTVAGGVTAAGTTYLNASSTLTVNGTVSDGGAAGLDTVELVLVADDQQFNATRSVSVSGGEFDATLPLSSGLPAGNYSVVVRASDAVGNDATVDSGETVAYDATAPSPGVAVIAESAAKGRVNVTVDEPLPSAPTVNVTRPEGGTVAVQTTKVGGTYTGTFSLGAADGTFTATTNVTDRAGNVGRGSSSTTINTNVQVSGQTVLIETGDGTFIELELNSGVSGGVASLTSSDTPLAALGQDLSGDQFIEGELGDTLSNKLNNATIGIPRSEVTLPPGVDASQVEIRRYNETRGEFVSVGQTSVDSRTINGTTRSYFLVTVDHFSTYGAVQRDTAPPTVNDVRLSSPGTRTGDRTFAYDTDEVTTTVDYSDDVSGVNASAVTVKLDGTPVSSLSNATADVTADSATVTATGLVGSGSHTLNVTVVDEAGNRTVNRTTFTVARDTTAPTVTSGDLPATLPYGTTTETVRVNYTDAQSGVDTSSVTVLVDGRTLPDRRTAVDDETVTVTLDGLSPGASRSVEVRVDDASGTTGKFTGTLSVQSDTDDPRVTDTTYSPSPVAGTEFAPTTDQVTLDLSVADGTSGIDPANVTVAFGESGTTLSDVTSQAVVTDTQVSYTATDLDNGTTYELRATLEDEGGNTETVTRTVTVRPDRTAPTVRSTTIQTPDGATPSFDNGVEAVDVQFGIRDNLDAVAPGRVTVEFGPAGSLRDVTGSAAITGSSVAYTATELDNNTRHRIRVTLVDRAGNRRVVTRSFTVGQVSTVTGGGVVPPTAALSAPQTATVGESVRLDASGSTDNAGIVRYRWDLDGDGTYERQTGDPQTTVTFETAGSQTVTVQAIDGADERDTATVTVDVQAADDATTTQTATATRTTTATPTATETPTGTTTETPGVTETVAVTETATDTPAGTETPRATDTPAPTATAATDTPTATPRATDTPTETVAVTETATDTPAATPTPTETSTQSPGFGAVVSVAALAALAVLALRRRS